jgi:hypothetical protein
MNMNLRIMGKIIYLVLFTGICAGATIQRSTLSENFGVEKERTLVRNDGAYFTSDSENSDKSKRFVLGFDVTVESKTVRLFLKRAKGISSDASLNNLEVKYITVSSCVLDEKRKCGKQSIPIPLRSVGVEIGEEGQQPTAILITTFSGPLNNGAKPYYDVYSPTFSPRMLIKVANEQQQKALQSLLR